MVVGVDQYKRIRKMVAEDELSQREIARRLGISRNTVARYCKGEHMPLHFALGEAAQADWGEATSGSSSA
jgi:transcriptional regulator with XRE-family HTH domain